MSVERPSIEVEVEKILRVQPSDVLIEDAQRLAREFLKEKIKEAKDEEAIKGKTKPSNPVTGALENFSYLDSLRQNPNVQKVISIKRFIDLKIGLFDFLAFDPPPYVSLWSNETKFYIVNALDSTEITNLYNEDSQMRSKIKKWSTRSKSSIARQLMRKI